MKETLHIYTRVSTSIQQEEGTSLTTQKEIGIELSKKLDMDYKVHNEGGMSSSKDTLDNRPVLVNVLKLMDEKVIKNLYVWNTDRLSRNQITWYTIRQKMVKNEVVLYTSNGIHNTTDFMENMILGILSEVSQYDNQVRTERSRLGKIEKVKLNYWRGGDCPFGYKLQSDGRGNKLVEDKTESRWIRFLYSEYSKGTSLNKIKSVLEENHIKTRRENNIWSMGSLQVILRNETYLGIDQYVDKKTNLTIRNIIPQLVSNKLWEKVQERRKVILLRKNQINRTKNHYLFRDFLVCSCGTPMGGRMKPLLNQFHYYCPLPERRFNNSYKMEVNCHMKRCLDITLTDQILWDKVVDILSDTIGLKKTMNEKTIIGKSLKSIDLKNEIKSKEEKIDELMNTKDNLEKGIVEIETNKILKKYPSEDVYKSLKKHLITKYNKTKSDIEDIKNTLKQVENQEVWFQTIDYFGNLIREDIGISEPMRRELLNTVIDFILVDYDLVEKVHRLKMNFKLPVVTTNTYLHLPYIRSQKTSETLDTLNDQTLTVENYSTVTDLARFRG